MPQLSQIAEIYASQLFWLAIVFALIYFGIGRGMVPKIEKTIDDRNGKVAGDLAAAEAARSAAEASNIAYNASLDGARGQAMKSVAEAKAKAIARAEAVAKQADAEMLVRLAAATDSIEGRKQAALGEIEASTVEAVEAIVAKLSGVSTDRALVEQQVKVALAHG
ncbi:ATPase [Sphingomonas sp. 28-62-11]|uniref:F0F1 ATP synthase subunit B family protein n=1 Tax=Sphingomonas sp. 28-62-11 TaxID=1970432 RepID=UPI000BDD5EF9|nr:MAG: ATPase [Sphingomonas sp. 28-62-11]